VTSDNVTTQLIPAIADSAPHLKLVVQNGLGVGTTIDARRVVTLVGSRKGCKVNLRHPKVSPVHVAIVNTGSRLYAVDLVTRAGTLLNGLKMEHEELSDGDVLAIGPWQFSIGIEAASQGKRNDSGAGLPAYPPRVVGLELLPSGRLLRPNRDVCVIGRRSGCDITISDQRVSRAHALLLNYLGYPVIVDLLSHNQTMVNGSTVTFQVLADGDTIRVGETEFRARLVESPIQQDAAETRDRPETGGGHIHTVSHSDQINIEAVEGSQTWTIADKLERATRKR